MYNRQKNKLVASFDTRDKSWSTLLYEDKVRNELWVPNYVRMLSDRNCAAMYMYNKIIVCVTLVKVCQYCLIVHDDTAHTYIMCISIYYDVVVVFTALVYVAGQFLLEIEVSE